ncbi:hypothetical protein AY600_05580 [Phormidium willei BDU 130791]|nr:hypothetical protein AY600_05580 [Phormidium willei BDU 130791]
MNTKLNSKKKREAMGNPITTKEIKDKFVHEHLPGIGLGNRGCLLIMLYVLLVVPKQLLEDTFPDDFRALDERIDELKKSSESTYPTDREGVSYLRHVRNAVVHARVSFEEPEAITFRDQNGQGSEFKLVISLGNIGHVLTELQNIFMKYVKKAKDGFQA